MVFEFLIKGIVIGFSIAAPVGPIGILTIQRSMNHGAWAGFATGMGAATADALYGCVAGFGLTLISNWLLEIQTPVLLGGGLFLCGLGLSTLKQPPPQGQRGSDPIFKGYLSSYLSTFFLTLTNPMTIMAFMAIFAGLGLSTMTKGYAGALSLVTGVFLGSCLWWMILTWGVGQLKPKLDKRFQATINRGAGMVLLVFGFWALIRLIP
ncbi:MAG: LysE family translocator [Proteobacteria bacterium]|nr:LysE family translocator [Desulfobacula sp.]MBU3950843.1 LysE family translocator [Pseudomonadota bacterium]MBU4130723.1 LysE family translocator [Pseudomonadota bacterium]